MIALFSPEELRDLHVKVVDQFHAHRPVGGDIAFHCGLKIWIATNGDDRSIYVQRHIEHHVRCALGPVEHMDTGLVPSCIKTWVSQWPCYNSFSSTNVKQDNLYEAVVAVLGDRRHSLARAAIAENDWW